MTPADLNTRYDLRLSLLLMATGAGAAWLIFVPSAQSYFNSVKAWELTTQLCLIAILGGAVALFYRFWETARAKNNERLDKEREHRAVERASLQEFYRSFGTMNNQYKKIRRTLRATTFFDQDQLFMERRTFEELMDGLEDCQLSAENMAREVEAQKNLFGTDWTILSESLKKIESYLRELLREYEEDYNYRRDKGPKDLVKIDDSLKDFIMRRRGQRSRPLHTELLAPGNEIRNTMLTLIAKRSA